MQDFSAAFGLAFALIFEFDADLVEIIGLSLRVSLTAVLISAAIGLPLGALAGAFRFPGRAAPNQAALRTALHRPRPQFRLGLRKYRRASDRSSTTRRESRPRRG